MQNPWSDLINSKQPHIANCDVNAIKAMPPELQGCLKLELFPEPFIGNPDAKIYLLNGNPGFHENDKFFLKSQKYIKALKDTLELQANSFLYLDSGTCTFNNITHPGYEWWKRHLKQLTQLTLPNEPNVFNIEYFPYHSENMNELKKHWIEKDGKLPSDDFSNKLVNEAMNAGKIIVVMRLRDYWYKRIPYLKTYSNLIVLNNPQSVHITPNNVRFFVEDTQKSQDNWDKIIKNV